MKIMKVRTASGSRYRFIEESMFWERENARAIHGIPLMSDRCTWGNLVEWPVVILGRGMTFDDTKHGVVYTTPVVRCRLEFEDEE